MNVLCAVYCNIPVDVTRYEQQELQTQEVTVVQSPVEEASHRL